MRKVGEFGVFPVETNLFVAATCFNLPSFQLVLPIIGQDSRRIPEIREKWKVESERKKAIQIHCVFSSIHPTSSSSSSSSASSASSLCRRCHCFSCSSSTNQRQVCRCSCRPLLSSGINQVVATPKWHDWSRTNKVYLEPAPDSDPAFVGANKIGPTFCVLSLKSGSFECCNYAD